MRTKLRVAAVLPAALVVQLAAPSNAIAGCGSDPLAIRIERCADLGELTVNSPVKLAEAAAELAIARAEVEAAHVLSQDTLDCWTCLRNEQVGFAMDEERDRAGVVYGEVYDRYDWVVDLNRSRSSRARSARTATPSPRGSARTRG